MKTKTNYFSLAAALFTITVNLAAAQTSPKHVIIKAGHLLDVRTGKLLSNQTLTIEGDKIVSITSASEVKASAADVVVDLSRATVLPGLIDAHTPHQRP